MTTVQPNPHDGPCPHDNPVALEAGANRSFVKRALAALGRRTLVANALSLYALQGVNYLVPLLLLPYLLRVLSPQGYGAVAFAQSLLGYALILTEFGFNLTAARDISVARGTLEKVARIYWTTMFAKLLLGLASIALVCIVTLAIPQLRAQWPVFAASSLLVVGNVAFPQWYFQALERLREVALVQGVAKCIVAAGVFILVRSPADAWIAALILSAPQCIGAVAALCLRQSIVPATFYRPSLRDVRDAMRHSAHMFASIVSTTLYLHTNTLVLGFMSGERSVALYSIGTRLIGALQSVASPVVQSVFPRASLLFAERPGDAWRLLRRVAWAVLPAVAVASVLLGVFAPEVVQLLGGRAYLGARSVVRIMSPIPILVAVATGLSQVVLVNLGLTKQLSRIYFSVGCLNLLLLPWLISRYSAVGAAIALLVAETVGPILMAFTVIRRARSAPIPGR